MLRISDRVTSIHLFRSLPHTLYSHITSERLKKMRWHHFVDLHHETNGVQLGWREHSDDWVGGRKVQNNGEEVEEE